tara:strand:+ start:59 stop:859 length:801 start_codon:yes stop_codon:yes gene_type:complete
MPELPEVETIKNQLVKKIKSKTISKVVIRDYKNRFIGRKQKVFARIKNIERRAKQIIFNLANGYSFIIHLKMTGQLIYHRKLPAEIKKATHVIFSFSDGSSLFFNDFRKFGFVKVMKTEKVEGYFRDFGPDSLKVGFPEFRKVLEKKKRSKLKPTLLDQTVLAGLGNIYAQEACFKAGVLPDRVIGSLTDSELKKLHSAIQTILRLAIKHQGTSFDTSYRTVEDQPGGFKHYINVYHQKDCSRCKSKLKSEKLGGRSTYYCKKCQK